MAFKINSNSKIMAPDGSLRRLDSLTEEEYHAFCRSVGERIGRALQDYVNQHPEEYEQILDALEAAGATVVRYWLTDDNESKKAV